MPAAQTRLPGELAQELEGIASDFEADLMAFQQAAYETSDSEAEEVEPLRPLRNFPALGLITAMHSAIEVRPLTDRPSLANCLPFGQAKEGFFWLPQKEARAATMGPAPCSFDLISHCPPGF